MKYNVLMVDDNNSHFFLQPLRESAFHFQINLEWKMTWEEARALLENGGGHFSGLILDGKGQKTMQSKAEDDSFLSEVKDWLTEKARTGNYIPYVVYTGFADELKRYFDKMDIFWKDRGEEEMMFKRLTEKIEHSGQQQIKEKYQVLFAAIGGKYLPQHCSANLIQLLIWSEEAAVEKKWFNTLRDFIEVIFKRANQIDNDFLPAVLFNAAQNNRPNLKLCSLYWSNRQVDLSKAGGVGVICSKRPILNPHNRWLTDGLVQVTQILSHPYDDMLTIFAYRSCINSLAELLIWFKKYIDINYPSI